MKLTFYKRFIVLASISLLCGVQISHAQHQKRKVLFIGNSFTATNDLPILLKSIAASAGDTLETDWNTPGGATLEQHTTDGLTLDKISKGDWNYVVLQEQSQKPAFPDADVARNVFPYARTLDSLVHDKNICGRSVFFQTWAYRNGDAATCASFPPVCTYAGMDSLLEKRYRQMATNNMGLLAPVGSVFTALQGALAGIELYSADDMHPSEAGTYAAAITFYTILFQKDPTLVSFDFTLAPPVADLVRQIVKMNVYNSMPRFFVGMYDPAVSFTHTISGNTVTFNSSISNNVSNYNWDFGDGSRSTLANPTHTYATTGSYTVQLVGDNCILQDTAKNTITTLGTGIVEDVVAALNHIEIYPNPARTTLNIYPPVAFNDVALSISTLLGTTVLSTPKFDGQPVPIENLATGIYLIHLKNNVTGERIMRKFIKE